MELAGNSPQNPDLTALRGQNLDSKRFRAWLAIIVCTAFASAMICCLKFEVKVGHHILGCGKSERESLARMPILEKWEGWRLTDTIHQRVNE
jgi:hypothetical protein